MAHWRQVNTYVALLANRGHCMVCLECTVSLRSEGWRHMEESNYIKLYVIFHQYLLHAWGMKTAPDIWLGEMTEKAEFKHQRSSGMQIHCAQLVFFGAFLLFWIKEELIEMESINVSSQPWLETFCISSVLLPLCSCYTLLPLSLHTTTLFIPPNLLSAARQCQHGMGLPQCVGLMGKSRNMQKKMFQSTLFFSLRYTR